MTVPAICPRPRARLTLAMLALLAGCKAQPHPWDQGDAATPPPPPMRVAASAEPQVLTASPPEPDPDLLGDAAPAAEGEEVGPPVRVGGPWVRCYGNFKASGDPAKDVTRLSLLCGPENGMVRLGDKRLEGAVREGGASVSTTFEAKRGG